MDAIAFLTAEHRRVDDLFTQFEQAGPRAHKTKQRLVDSMIEQLSLHAGIEEMVFYPAVRRAQPALEGKVLEALEEHHGAKAFLVELEKLPAQAERFDAKVAVLTEQVRHHVKEEESELFPQVRKAMSKAELDDLAEGLQRARQTAPVRPHPMQADTPPANLLLGLPVAALDRVVGAVRKAIR
ncbi:MAG: hemerythrin domain-containing protein [Acidimicrobiales bacterium]